MCIIHNHLIAQACLAKPGFQISKCYNINCTFLNTLQIFASYSFTFSQLYIQVYSMCAQFCARLHVLNTSQKIQEKDLQELRKGAFHTKFLCRHSNRPAVLSTLQFEQFYIVVIQLLGSINPSPNWDYYILPQK